MTMGTITWERIQACRRDIHLGFKTPWGSHRSPNWGIGGPTKWIFFKRVQFSGATNYHYFGFCLTLPMGHDPHDSGGRQQWDTNPGRPLSAKWITVHQTQKICLYRMCYLLCCSWRMLQIWMREVRIRSALRKLKDGKRVERKIGECIWSS